MNPAQSEMFEERAAIREYDGLMTRVEAERLAMLDSEQWREACEVRHVIRLALSDRRAYIADVGRQRGGLAEENLKNLVLKEWARLKSA